MTPEQKKHADKANALEDKASTLVDRAKHGSPTAAQVIVMINKERDKAGLIKGGYKQNGKV